MIYHFRKARESEAEIIYSMIADRVQWMNENNIQQWNTTDYLNVYPLSYYQKNLSQLYVLTKTHDTTILCAAILLENDERWNHSMDPAFYIHNFVSALGISGIGKIFISEVEHYALQQGKLYLRLDSSDDNKKLAHYYKSMGFQACGSCQEGIYHGILRQKEIRK